MGKVHLVKWPAMIVKGKQITPDQAKEIILRTDVHQLYFAYAGNDRYFRKDLMKVLGCPERPMKFNSEEERAVFNQIENDWTSDAFERYQPLHLHYLANDRILSSFIGGPHGWCDLFGNIFSNNYNIGKWPSIEEVLEEWQIIAEAFPFLELDCWIMDGETGSCKKAVVQYTVKKGKVRMRIPPEQPSIIAEDFDLQGFASTLMNPRRERGCSIEEFKEMLEITEKRLK
jgi:hypothetical protein